MMSVKVSVLSKPVSDDRAPIDLDALERAIYDYDNLSPYDYDNLSPDWEPAEARALIAVRRRLCAKIAALEERCSDPKCAICNGINLDHHVANGDSHE
jgi:hypothetical protein